MKQIKTSENSCVFIDEYNETIYVFTDIKKLEYKKLGIEISYEETIEININKSEILDINTTSSYETEILVLLNRITSSEREDRIEKGMMEAAKKSRESKEEFDRLKYKELKIRFEGKEDN